MRKLRDTAFSCTDPQLRNALGPLAERVLDKFSALDNNKLQLPARIVHGDPQISNFLFNSSGDKAIAMLDLDTMARMPLIADLGDAIRSMTNTGSEDSPGAICFNTDYFEAFMRGYMKEAGFINIDELYAIPRGIELITLKLCARFITDAYEQKYFKYDADKYSSLFEQNLQKAKRQLAFYDDFIARRNHATAIIRNYIR
jgi:Ser/Thr protein kinase RdoA (MazF antagonist)